MYSLWATRVGQRPADAGRDETIHTTANHPWLTADKGWEQAGVLRVGEAVVTADGDAAVVVTLHVLPGAANMWDLTVSNMHTFVVGSGTYVVHNCPAPDDDQARGRSAKRSDRMIKQVANRKGISARAFGDYVEAMKDVSERGTLNTRGDFTWQELLDLADDYIKEGGD